jgi:hypothetical protein
MGGAFEAADQNLRIAEANASRLLTQATPTEQVLLPALTP